MSMQTALGFAGFAVGSFFSYPQLGFVVGSLVGAALTPAQKVEGPRIDDQKVTVSSEGTGIPRVWGTVRLGGNVIESTDKIEVSKKQTQGKGGGVESTTYSYYVNMRTLLCEAKEGVSYAIRKIWKNGKLIYDVSSGISIGSALASADSPGATLILYQGQEDQLPDPTEEARHGVGNVPAYRGVVSVVMNHVDCPGGQVPQFSYELCVDPESTAEATVGAAMDFAGGNKLSFSRVPVNGDPVTIFRERSVSIPGYAALQKVVDVFAFGFDYSTPLRSFQPFDTAGNLYSIPGTADIDAVFYGRYTASVYANTGTHVVLEADGAAHSFTLPFGVIEANGGWSKLGELFAVHGYGSALLDWGSGAVLGTDLTTDVRGLWVGSGCVWAMTVVSGVFTLQARSVEDFSVLASAAIPAGVASLDRSFQPDGESLMLYARSSSTNVQSWRATLSGATISWAQEGVAAILAPEVYRDQIAIGYSAGLYGGVSTPSGDLLQYFTVAFDRLNSSPVAVAEIIADECRLAGLDDGEFDVSSISEEVHGYTISNPASARAAIQPLMTVFSIDATEEDGKLKFFNRSDKTSIATISYDELGCVEDGSEPGDPMPLTRANVTELYRSVTVSYINPEFDYQTSTEPAQRQITGATADQNEELAIAMSPDQAATAAHRILYDNHNDRNRRSFKVSRKYAYISAGDVTTVEYPRGTLSDWRWLQVTDTGALIEVEAVPANAELYAQTAIGGTGYAGQQVEPIATPTRLVVMEGMPILRDADNDAGNYSAMSGFNATGWRGATLFVGDNDATLNEVGSVTRSAVIGFAENEAPAGRSGYIDATTRLIVNVGAGELNSATWEDLIIRGANTFALGITFQRSGFPDTQWEICQFLTATSLGNGRYALTSLIRCLRGTEAASFNHRAGDTFVMLRDDGLLHVGLDAGNIGASKRYRAVSFGRSLDSVSSLPAAVTGYGLRPFSPVNVRLIRTDPAGIVWTWNRRTRMSGNWLRGIVPLGEGSEIYEVVVYTDSSYSVVQRVIRVYQPTATYTNADLTADGRTVLSTVPYRIYQISSSVGRGIPFQPGQGLS